MKSSHWPLTLLNTLVSLLQLVVPLVLVRIFDQEGVGSYKIFFLYLGLLAPLSGGTGFLHGLAFWTSREEHGGASVRQSWTMLVGYSCILLVLGASASPLLNHAFNNWTATCSFVIAGGTLLLNQFYEETWIARGRIWLAALYRGGSELLRSSLVLVVALRTKNVNDVFLAHAVFLVLRVLIATLIAHAQQFVRLHWDSDTVREVLSYALPVSSAGFLSALANTADQMLLSVLLSKADFAVFSLGCLAVPPLVALDISVNQVLAARMARLIGAGKRNEAVQEYRNACYELARFMIPSCVGLIVFAAPIVTLLYTDRYLASASILRVSALGYLLIAIPYDGGPRSTGQGRWALRTFLVKTGISLALVATLTPIFGIYGAMAGVLISGLYLRTAGLRFNKSFLGWKFTESLPLRRLFTCTGAATALGITSLLLRPLWDNPIHWFLACGGGFSLIYGSVFLVPPHKIASLLVVKRRLYPTHLARPESPDHCSGNANPSELSPIPVGEKRSISA